MAIGEGNTGATGRLRARLAAGLRSGARLPSRPRAAGRAASGAPAESADVTRHHAERLQEALAARSAITQAEGVIMEHYRVSAAAAHQMLRDISRRGGSPLREVALAVVNASEQGPAAPTLTRQHDRRRTGVETAMARSEES